MARQLRPMSSIIVALEVGAPRSFHSPRVPSTTYQFSLALGSRLGTPVALCAPYATW